VTVKTFVVDVDVITFSVMNMNLWLWMIYGIVIWIYDYQSDWGNKDNLIFIFSSSKQIVRYSGAIATL
jgi:hypothetical protein